MAGTFKVRVTVVDAPIARGPSAAGSAGPASVTLPDPESVRAITVPMLNIFAAEKPVFVSCTCTVTVVPDCETLDTWPLRLGGPQVPDAFTVVVASEEVFAGSRLPVRSEATL